MNAPMPSAAPAAGFAEPVLESQSTFRAAMRALAEPGGIEPLAAALAPPAPLSPTAAALLLALADFETPVWLDAAASADPAVGQFLRFHTGASLVEDRAKAAFALVTGPALFDGLDGFARGTLDYPDRSTTLILQVDALAADGALTLSGPGIAGERRLGVAPIPRGLVAALAVNRAQFPRGVDLILAAPGHIAGLPRSTRVTTEDPSCM
jgi:alpha-D-ribose 1-methylphosphonate 5-triphosphate synthase subunit PhnH